jgi:hypothetical protein
MVPVPRKSLYIADILAIIEVIGEARRFPDFYLVIIFVVAVISIQNYRGK